MALDNRGPQLSAVTILFLSLSVISVGLRCHVRAGMLRYFGADDWLALATLITFILYSGFVLSAVKYGAGRHVADVSLKNISIILKCRLFGELFYVASSVLVKYTAGLFLLRITTAKWHTVVIWTVLVVMLIFNIYFTIIVIIQCQPTSFYWTRLSGDVAGKCLSNSLVSHTTYVGTAINAWADWVLGLLPIFLVWNLSLKRREKMLVAMILALGSIACTATVVRGFYVWQLTEAKDLLYEFTDIAIWSTVENGLGLTAVSIATLRPLARKYLAQRRSSNHTYSLSHGAIIPMTRTPFQHRSWRSRVEDVQRERMVLNDMERPLNRQNASGRSSPWSQKCEAEEYQTTTGAFGFREVRFPEPVVVPKSGT